MIDRKVACVIRERDFVPSSARDQNSLLFYLFDIEVPLVYESATAV